MAAEVGGSGQIRPDGPWRDVEHVELETLKWVDWFKASGPTRRSTTSHRYRQSMFTTLQETVSSRPGRDNDRSLRKLRGGSPLRICRRETRERRRGMKFPRFQLKHD